MRVSSYANSLPISFLLLGFALRTRSRAICGVTPTSTYIMDSRSVRERNSNPFQVPQDAIVIVDSEDEEEHVTPSQQQKRQRDNSPQNEDNSPRHKRLSVPDDVKPEQDRAHATEGRSKAIGGTTADSTDAQVQSSPADLFALVMCS